VYKRIEPVVHSLGANEVRRPSKFSDDDDVRWKLLDDEGSLDELIRELERKLPLDSQLAIRRSIKLFGGNTSDLLHFVYRTPPILRAAPNDLLDFSVAQNPAKQANAEVGEVEREPTYKEQKRQKERLSAGREKVAKRLEEVRARRLQSKTTPKSPSDEEYAEVANWLDEIAGGSMRPIEGEIEFSDAIWKSPGRWEPFDT
jgi:hypothetical protein